MSARRRPLKYRFCALALCLLGLWYAGSALTGLAHTAIFVHEAAIVEGTVGDVRQKPFDSWADTLGKGNLSWPGDVSYQPIVNFRMPSGLAVWYANLDADNEDYHKGQMVSIIVPPDSPGKARLNRWKFLWGADCLRLLAGALLLLPGWYMLRQPRPALKQEKPRRHPAPARKTAPDTPSGRAPEESFALTPEPPAPRRKSAPRKRKTTADGEPKAPRSPRSRKKTEEGASPAPRRRKPRSKA